MSGIVNKQYLKRERDVCDLNVRFAVTDTQAICPLSWQTNNKQKNVLGYATFRGVFSKSSKRLLYLCISRMFCGCH